mgnify:CR=1 FL=1
MNQFTALVFNTIQKEIRRKSLIFALAFTVIVILLSIFLVGALKDMVSEYSEVPLLSNEAYIYLIFMVITSWNSILGFIMGSDLVKSDEKLKISPLILSFPISRNFYLLSRIFGAWLLIGIYYVFSLILAVSLYYFSMGEISASPLVFVALIFSSLTTLAAITLGALFSTFMPNFFSIMSSFIMFVIITIANSMKFDSFDGEAWKYVIWRGIDLIFPPVGNLSKVTTQTLSKSFEAKESFMTLGHFSLTFVGLYLIFFFIYKKKSF